MSLKRGQAGREAAEAGDGARRWEAAAQRRAQAKAPAAPGTAQAAPGRCGRWGTTSRGGPSGAKRWLGNGFAVSVGGLEKIGEVWEPWLGCEGSELPPRGCHGPQWAGLGGVSVTH